MAQVSRQIGTTLGTVNQPGWVTGRFVLVAPILLVIGLFCFSPNFDYSNQNRQSPFGGDFLQEWVGGRIILSDSRSKLYELDYFASQQHDPSLVGFAWQESSYYPPIYPPFYYLLISPFSSLEYRVAVVFWCILSALALIASGVLLFRFYPPASGFMVIGFVLATIFAPTINCLNIGHKSTFLLLILTSSFLLCYHKKLGWAGVVFGLVAFKPHLALSIGLMMLFKRQWRFVAGATATVGMLVLLSIIAGIDLCVEYFHVCLQTGNYVQTGGYQFADAHCLWGAVQNAMQGHSALAVKVTTLVLSLPVFALLIWILRGRFATESDGFAFQFSAMVLATIVLSPHLYFYDLMMILLPLLLIWNSAKKVLANNEKYKKPARYLIVLVVITLFGAGSFQKFAAFTLIQPSVLLIVDMLIVIAIVMHGIRKQSVPVVT